MPSWGKIALEIQNEQRRNPGIENSRDPSDRVRQKYLNQLHAQTGRNIICYYSGFLHKPRLEGIDINDEDKHAFMECVGGIDHQLGLDLFIHSPGGNGAATKSLVEYLRKLFGNNIRAVVPQIAMSAGTLIALSCKEIMMGDYSNIGPVDPQVYGFPAIAVLS
jgi:ClpP class serine protease